MKFARGRREKAGRFHAAMQSPSALTATMGVQMVANVRTKDTEMGKK